MAKRQQSRRRRPEVASSELHVHPDATVGPDASLDGTAAGWRERDSTNAPEIGEEEESGNYASGYPALIEKFLHDRLPLRLRTVLVGLLVTWFVFVSWLFVQDNSTGALDEWGGLKWFAVKVVFYSLFFVVFVAFVAIVLWISGKIKAGRLTTD